MRGYAHGFDPSKDKVLARPCAQTRNVSQTFINEQKTGEDGWETVLTFTKIPSSTILSRHFLASSLGISRWSIRPLKGEQEQDKHAVLVKRIFTE